MPIVPDGYGGDQSGDFSYAGADYKLGETLRLSYFYGGLENFYRQNFAGIQHDLPLGPGVFTSDLRFFNSADASSAYGGNIENGMLSGLLSYAIVAAPSAPATKNSAGKGGPYISGATVYSISNAGIGKIIEEDEKTWMLGYGYDFARLGIPGLTFASRYLSGDDGTSNSAVKEWGRDAEVAYVVPQGTFKGLGVKLRNYAYRADFARGRDSNRLYLTYDVALW